MVKILEVVWLIPLRMDFFYLITAAHVLEGMKHNTPNKLSFFRNGNWMPPMDIIPYFNEEADVAVVKTPMPVPNTESLNTKFSSEGTIIGQDVYFLGYPYFGGIDYNGDSVNDGYPLPFVKKATYSACRDETIYLDGHNNPGFSGGSVVFWNSVLQVHNVVGIISSYLTHKGEVKKIPTSLNSQLFYEENSGIAVAYNIKYAMDMVHSIR